MKARESEGVRGPAVEEVGRGGRELRCDRATRAVRERKKRGQENDSSAPFSPPIPKASVAPSRIWHGSASPIPARNRWEFLGIP